MPIVTHVRVNWIQLVWPRPFAPFFNNPFALIDHVVNKNNKLFFPFVNHYITHFIHFLLVNPDRCINGMPISCPQIWWVHSPMPKSLSMKQSHGQRVLNCQLSRKMEKVKIMYFSKASSTEVFPLMHMYHSLFLQKHKNLKACRTRVFLTFCAFCFSHFASVRWAQGACLPPLHVSRFMSALPLPSIQVHLPEKS